MKYPRPQQVAPGVAWFAAMTPTLPPATHTNSYALGERQVLLVEPATPHEDERREWLAWARGLISQGRELVAIFVTHHHPDHIGGAPFFAEELSLPMWGHAITDDLLDHLSFARHLEDGEWVSLDGPQPQRWRCLHTPGHAAGHLCLLEEDLGVLIVGDMVASEGTILVAPDDGDMSTYLSQLRRLSALPATQALPAHGAPIEQPRRLFDHYVKHRLEREAKIVAALNSLPDGGDLEQLVAIAYDDTPQDIWVIAKLSLESHLLKLEQDGVASCGNAHWHIIH